MPRFKLLLEYDGTSYYGWQFQKEKTTIMGVLMDAIKSGTGIEKFELYGAGRTDSGVHAIEQVAHLDIKINLKPREIMYRLNDNLPATINILDVIPVNENFHARYDAVARSYVYHIAARRTAFGKKYSWWVKDPLNIKSMQESAHLFEGTQDFRSFGTSEDKNSPTKVQVYQVRIEKAGDSIFIHIAGSHFLWKMVRRMVGVLVECGRDKMNGNDILSFLSSYSDVPAKLTVPPSGLFLEKVYYDKIPVKFELKFPKNFI